MSKKYLLLGFLACLAAWGAHFEPWDQVIALWHSGKPLIELRDNIHFLRYLVAYPGLVLNSHFGGDAYFSAYVALMLFFFLASMLKIGFIVSNSRIFTLRLACMAIGLWAITFAMNGRGVFAWLAWAMAILVLIKIRGGRYSISGELLLVNLALFLGAVSTGVLAVVFLYFFLFALYDLTSFFFGKRMSKKRLIFDVAMLVSLGCWTGQFFAGVDKNLDYFGDGFQGVLNMMHHGMGRLLFDFPPLWGVALLVFFGISYFVFRLLAKRADIDPLIFAVICGAIGGIFGLTVLTLAIPPMALLLYRKNIAGWRMQSATV